MKARRRPATLPHLTENLVAAAIIRNRWSHGVSLPRFAPDRWLQCDVFHLTKAGYFYEYEIKLSRADMKKDSKKELHDHRTPWHMPPVMLNKHQLLKEGDPRGPVRFYFVVPEWLDVKDLVPKWAGIWTVGVDRDRNVRLRHCLKEPKRLHNTKASPAVRHKMYEAAYYRFNQHFAWHDNRQTEEH